MNQPLHSDEESAAANDQNQSVEMADPLHRGGNHSLAKPSNAKGRHIAIREAVMLRVKIVSITSGKSVSTVIEEILDKHLPHFDVKPQHE